MSLSYYARDERPFWEATVSVNGLTDDMTSGYTFEVNIATESGGTPVVTKTTGVTGGTGGLVTVAWQEGDLDLDPGTYYAQLTATRISDLTDWTVEERIKIKARSV